MISTFKGLYERYIFCCSNKKKALINCYKFNTKKNNNLFLQYWHIESFYTIILYEKEREVSEFIIFTGINLGNP